VNKYPLINGNPDWRAADELAHQILTENINFDGAKTLGFETFEEAKEWVVNNPKLAGDRRVYRHTTVRITSDRWHNTARRLYKLQITQAVTNYAKLQAEPTGD